MPVDRERGDDLSEPIDRLVIAIRAYVTRAPKKPKAGAKAAQNKTPGGRAVDWRKHVLKVPPSDWVLVFDCETRTTPDQRLRFGAYQLRYKGQVWERGAFYEPDVLTMDELATLRQVMADEDAKSGGERICLRTKAEFVDKVFYASGYAVGAQIVGFNLPFDLSRLAIRHASARRSMRGGFSLTLSEDWPPVAVKHLSQRSALIRFTGDRPAKELNADQEEDAPEDDIADETDAPAGPDRGYFVDVKTLAAALTSKSHSLASLSALLKVPTPKNESDEHGGALTPDYVRYGLRDVQTTWECFDALAQRFATFGLNDTGLYDLYSEASLGKAYLRTMRIRPWREVQPDFPPELVGQILSAYYGGRAEVLIRRQTTPVVHCDFLSMYPTVCTLMGLWGFVRADGVTYRDDTPAVKALLARSRDELAEHLRTKDGWNDLAALVQVRPKRDLFPVRAQYPGGDTLNIGLNYLSADEPQWFTIADVLASKILTGKTPQVTAALRFKPLGRQTGMKPIEVAGQTIDPASDDFYQRLILHRNAIKAKLEGANDGEKAALRSDEQGIKILANATSYGIFVELNVEDYVTAKPMVGHGGRSEALRFKSKEFEKPGAYFHPLLATLITGAARLMLALAEYQVIEHGLDWVLCDTDSIAIANARGLSQGEFIATALKVRDWFKDLNPYGEANSILQLEKVNFPIGKDRDLDALEPPRCLAVSAKRYVLFNRQDDGGVVRKASGHGLGHLMAPYDEPPAERRERVERIGVPLWQEDLWKEIIRAADSDQPDETHFIEMTGFDAPAASQYAATTPELLRWFDGYNERQPTGRKVFPFGFLLSLQAKSRIEMAKDESEALSHELWRRREPRPAAPYFKQPREAKHHAFDRERGGQIPASWLKSHGRSLVRYHLHPETKFQGGEFDQRGPLVRRHVFALAQQSIGKEADNIEENEFIGEDVAPREYGVPSYSRQALPAAVFSIQNRYGISDRRLLEEAKVSHRTLAGLREGKRIADTSLMKLFRAAEGLRQEADPKAAAMEKALEELRWLRDKVGGRNKLAKLLSVTGPYLGRVLRGEKPMTEELAAKIAEFEESVTGDVFHVTSN
ncbi:hypothetical protein [Roseiarcus sp.]|uniref:hypothetical protein n=1 Tax=Roseiarcus sp. TaxID=1969460 RepID=UPI003C5AE7F6